MDESNPNCGTTTDESLINTVVKEMVFSFTSLKSAGRKDAEQAEH